MNPVDGAEWNNTLIINEDCSHFYMSRTPEEMNLTELNAFIDQYAGTKVTHLFLNPNGMRTSFRSATREAIWDPVNGKEPTEPWAKHAKLLHERGLEPYKVWIDRCREKDIVPWISMRMNDVHDADKLETYMGSDFWRNNPQFWRVPHDTSGNWTLRALNFIHPEVREHAFSLLRELFGRYDFDGIELDWMRFGYHLTPGKEKDEGIVLTEFMRDVRKLANEWEQKRGHAIQIAVRVPADPDAATGLGMNAVQWAKEGSVDLIIPTPFWATSDFDIPVEKWRAELNSNSSDQSRKVAIAPGIEHSSRAWPGATPISNDLPCLYGFVAAERYRGANSIYLFNWMDSQTQPVSAADYRILLEKGVGDDVVNNVKRRHLVTFRDTVPRGVSENIQLPRKTTDNCKFTIELGPVPVSGKLLLILGLRENSSLPDTSFSVSLNGTDLEPLPDASDVKCYGDAKRAMRFRCPLNSAKNGTNEIQIRHKSGEYQEIVWVELYVDPNDNS